MFCANKVTKLPDLTVGVVPYTLRFCHYYAVMKWTYDFKADPEPTLHSNADPDPAFHSNADPDPAFHSHADPDPASKNNANADPEP